MDKYIYIKLKITTLLVNKLSFAISKLIVYAIVNLANQCILYYVGLVHLKCKKPLTGFCVITWTSLLFILGMV